MPCPHKFQEYLNLEKLDFAPETLIVGTFNPAWLEDNYAEWFYGRTGNNYFWDVLPRLYQPDLNLRTKGYEHVDWKLFCKENKIAITDLIYSIEDADPANPNHHKALKSYSDATISKQFSAITFTDIVGVLERYPSINSAYLTTQAKIDMFNQKWSEVEKYGKEKEIIVKRLLTPSAGARFQMREYKRKNPSDKTPLRNFIYKSWLEVWHF